MKERKRLIPRLLTAAIFILMEVAALNMLRRNAELQSQWLSRGAQRVMGVIWGGTERIKTYFSLRATNNALAEENSALLSENAALKEALAKGVAQADIPASSGFSYIPAEVIKLSRKKQHNYILLSKGYEDGVKEKSGIVTRCGVIGIVDAVSAHYSYGSSFQNNNISISARLGKEGGTGLLVWDGKGGNGAVLKEIPLQYKYEEGDTVYTSGHSLLFPPDIPLGIAGSKRIVNGSTNEIKVALFQDYSAVRYVTMVHNNSFDELEELEQ